MHWNQPTETKSFHFMITALNKDLRQENHQRVQSASENSVAEQKLSSSFPFPWSCHGDDDAPEAWDNHYLRLSGPSVDPTFSSGLQFSISACRLSFTSARLQVWMILQNNDYCNFIFHKPMVEDFYFSESGEKRLQKSRRSYHSYEYMNYQFIHTDFSSLSN